MKRYFKSIYTGQIYEMDSEPKFGGYVETTKEEYEEYKRLYL